MTDTLRKAAQACLDRWDSPAWEWSKQGPTAALFAELRRALAQADDAFCERRRPSLLLAALDLWIKKTDWVQESATPAELGMHRADVLRIRIERLQAKLKAMEQG
jgi:hypothetical protein